jgi:hypothetical protein
MKRDPEKIRALLDEVLPSSAEHCGPSRADILRLLRSNREHRRRQTVATALGLAMVLISVLWYNIPPAAAPVAQASAKPAPLAIRQVNDEQLFALLQGTPTALMEWPNGHRTLFVIEH